MVGRGWVGVGVSGGKSGVTWELIGSQTQGDGVAWCGWDWLVRDGVCLNRVGVDFPPLTSHARVPRPELYEQSVQQRYRELNPRGAPPHVYAVAERAFRGVSKTRPRSQVVYT